MVNVVQSTGLTSTHMGATDTSLLSPIVGLTWRHGMGPLSDSLAIWRNQLTFECASQNAINVKSVCTFPYNMNTLLTNNQFFLEWRRYQARVWRRCNEWKIHNESHQMPQTSRWEISWLYRTLGVAFVIPIPLSFRPKSLQYGCI